MALQPYIQNRVLLQTTDHSGTENRNYNCDDKNNSPVMSPITALLALTSEGGYERCPPQGDQVMKNSRFTSMLSFSLVACALTMGSFISTQSAAAQSQGTVASVTIPFAFQNGDQHMPAGVYRIERPSGTILQLRSPKANGYALIHPTLVSKAPERGKLVFARYGDKYYLRQVWTAGNREGAECSKSRSEKETLQAVNRQPTSSIQLAFNTAPR
ncbi:hypothetical protein [Granulicella sp. L60]|uniref:hypothetical protein n=1 Tax=Granulicella sp. L60 TaxID=1641866 RepID=UPI0020B163D8|nr:hypothetical protein [Granulicella sp. L60]